MTKQEIQDLYDELQALHAESVKGLTEQEQADKVQADLQAIRDSKPGAILHG